MYGKRDIEQGHDKSFTSSHLIVKGLRQISAKQNHFSKAFMDILVRISYSFQRWHQATYFLRVNFHLIFPIYVTIYIFYISSRFVSIPTVGNLFPIFSKLCANAAALVNTSFWLDALTIIQAILPDTFVMYAATFTKDSIWNNFCGQSNEIGCN